MAIRENPYRPYLGTIVGMRHLTPDIRSFEVELNDPAMRSTFSYRPGQFGFVSAFGVGEAPFCFASSANRGPALEFAINKVGTVTAELHRMGEGDVLGVRGPYGNWFPLDEMRGRDIILLGGGIGGAPLRPVIHAIQDERREFGDLTILWAARLPSMLIYSDEFDNWRDTPNTHLHVTVDRPEEGWIDNVGLITELLERVAPSPNNAVAIACGPPIMLKYTVLSLQNLGFLPDQIIVSLEAKMKCGIGKCGRCNLGEVYICTEGPVFTCADVASLLEGL